jgi:hypothetical protein
LMHSCSGAPMHFLSDVDTYSHSRTILGAESRTKSVYEDELTPCLF